MDPNQCAEPQPTGAVDRSVLDELSTMVGERGPSVAAEVVEAWCGESTLLLAVLAPDSTATTTDVRDAAHSLKSGCRMVGAMALGDAAEQIESAADADDLGAAAGPLAAASTMFEEAKAELIGLHPTR